MPLPQPFARPPSPESFLERIHHRMAIKGLTQIPADHNTREKNYKNS